MAHPIGKTVQVMKSFSAALIASLKYKYMVSLEMNYRNVLRGDVLVIDPSSGSFTSDTAYVRITNGKIVDSGIIPMPEKYLGKTGLIGHRCRELSKGLIVKFGDTNFDLLVVELLFHTPQENTVMSSFQCLTMAIGAVHAAIAAEYRMVIPPWQWQELRVQGYEKTDIGDATLMAEVLIRDSLAIAAKKKA